MNWLKFIIRRIVLIGVSLLVLSILVYGIMEVIPTDLARIILGSEATSEQVQALRVQLGLDKPTPIRYIQWLGGIVTGNLGESISLHTAVAPVLLRRTYHSLLLALTAALIGLPLAIAQGFIAGMGRPPWLDPVLSRTAVVIGSLPEFLVAMICILIFSEVAGWFPASSIVRLDSPLDDPKILVLPVLTLVLIMMAYNLRITRASVIKTLESDFVVAAELKQLPYRTIVWRHIAPNALLPTITVAANYLGWMFGGLVVIEAVFNYPGLGLLIYQAAKTNDVPLLEAAILLVGCFRMFVNLGADILYMVVDPRVRIS